MFGVRLTKVYFKEVFGRDEYRRVENPLIYENFSLNLCEKCLNELIDKLAKIADNIAKEFRSFSLAQETMKDK